jgi:predicted nucleic acid-binding protein
MHVFIDTNILLDLYHLSGPDLDELKKIVELIKAEKITVHLNSQIIDEFWRNRERVITDAIKLFKETKVTSKLPNLVRNYDEAVKLKEFIESISTIVKEITDRLEKDIQEGKLKPDEVLNELFSKATIDPVSQEIIDKAKNRVDLGNPPGKKGSIGDAIHWEQLLATMPDEDLTIISSDGDFESVLIKGDINEYLKREWHKKKGGNITLNKSLPEFLKSYFPNIKLSGEISKVAAIEKLESSWNFKETHQAIARLAGFDDFRDDEAQRIFNAYIKNNQIYGILGDEDVLTFANKMLTYAKSDGTLALANRLKEMILDIEDEFI